MKQSSARTAVLSQLENMDEVFALPQVIMELLQLVDSEQTTAGKIASVVMHDPNLTAKLLKMANSGFYRRGLEIATVNQAVMVLGVSMVKCLALSAAIFRPSEDFPDSNSFDIRELYSHFLGTAIAARMIAEEAGFNKPEEAFVAGLLHDLGHLLLIKAMPEVQIGLLSEHAYDPDLTKKERDLYGLDHAELGEMIARKWNLPEAFQSAIGNHHRMISEPALSELNKLDLIVLLADRLSGRAYAKGNRDIERHIQDVALVTSALDLQEELPGEIGLKLLSEIMEAAKFLGLDIGDPMVIVQRANRQLFESYSTIEALFKERQELSRRIIEEEYRIGAMRSKDIAIATLSHYINNAATIISGRSQLMQLMVKSGKLNDADGKLSEGLAVIDLSLTKIMAVLSELKALSDLDNVKFYNDSDAINIDENIRRRMEQMRDPADASEPVIYNSSQQPE